MNKRARGFSLVEVMVSLAMAAVLLATLMQIVVDANRAGRRTRIRAELANAGVIAATMLKNDLGAAGLGVPSAVEEASLSKAFGSAVLVAAPTGLGIVGDLARPDANYNTFGFLVDRAPTGGNDHHVSWTSENSGVCVVGAASCDTAATSLFFPGESGCDSESAATTDRTCPWGLKRLRGDEPFQVVAGNRRWFSATNKTTLEVHNHGSALFVHTGNALPATWTNSGPSTLPNAGAGQGWVTTLDRVFWRHNSAARTLERIQCWGAPDPTKPNWPVLTSTTIPASPCAAPFQGMAAYETVAKNVDSVAFTYFDANDVAVVAPNSAAIKATIRRIEFRILFRRPVGSIAVEHEAVGGVFLSGAL